MDDTAKEENLATRFGRSSPDPVCSICLCSHENICRPNKCLHSFCFICLLEWSKVNISCHDNSLIFYFFLFFFTILQVKAECPLCKLSFNSIIYNVRSNQDYDEHNIPVAELGVPHARPSLMFRLLGPPPLASDMFRSQTSQPFLQQILSGRLARRYRLGEHEVSSAPVLTFKITNCDCFSKQLNISFFLKAPNEIPFPAPHKPGSNGARQAAAALNDDGQSNSNVRLPSMLSNPSNDEEKDVDIVQVVRPSSKDGDHQ